MAFTKQPVQDTYQTKQVDLVAPMDKRSSDVTKDNDYLNCYFEIVMNKATQDHEIHIVKRPGTTNFSDAFGSTNFRGMYQWEDADKIIVAVDNDILFFNASHGNLITTLSNVLANSTGEVGFTSFHYDNNVIKVVVSDGANLYTIDSAGAWVASADADLPNPHVPMPVFLDGYIFLIKSGTADIYNSNLNDPLAWTPGDFLTAEMFPDSVRAIAKLNNYLIAFGSDAIEYFWDAGNASGTPLQRNDTPIKLISYLGGLAAHGNMLYFVGRTYQGSPSVYQLEDFKIKEVSTPTVRKYLSDILSITLLQTSFPYGTVISAGGHDFYVLTAGDITYVYDTKIELWSRWAYGNTDHFKVQAAYNNDLTTGNETVLYIIGQDRLLKLQEGLYRDNSTNFNCQIVTKNHMFDSYNQKTCLRACIVADRFTIVDPVSLNWTDDDYQNYGGGHNVDLSKELPCTYRLGRFRRRAFKINYIGNHPLRIQKLEIDINLGQH